jgi:ATP-dependent Clp protease protease subunit
LEGAIAETTWYGDEVTPKVFKDELLSGSGPVTVWINSPGGDVFAAAQIYTMLREYPGDVTVKINGVAASAASVVAMAGNSVLMSPVSCLMLHNPSTVAIGDGEEMLRAKALLDEVKESIINAYEVKTKLSRTKLSHLMDAETWMNAHKAVELGFADKVLYAEEESPPEQAVSLLFSRAAVTKAAAKTVAFGSFNYYWVADRQGRTFKRLNELFAVTGQVGFIGTQRVDGKVILPEAIKLLQQKKSA